MEIAALLLAAFLTALCVVFVARPLLRQARDGDALSLQGAADRDRLRLQEERDRALAALKDLEFDHRTGKVSDADYRALVGPLRREAAEALRALDADPAPAEPVAVPREP